MSVRFQEITGTDTKKYLGWDFNEYLSENFIPSLASRSNYFNHIELNDNPYGHDN